MLNPFLTLFWLAGCRCFLSFRYLLGSKVIDQRLVVVYYSVLEASATSYPVWFPLVLLAMFTHCWLDESSSGLQFWIMSLRWA